MTGESILTGVVAFDRVGLEFLGQGYNQHMECLFVTLVPVFDRLLGAGWGRLM